MRYTCSRHTLRVLGPLAVGARNLTVADQPIADDTAVQHDGGSRVGLGGHTSVIYWIRQRACHCKKDAYNA